MHLQLCVKSGLTGLAVEMIDPSVPRICWKLDRVPHPPASGCLLPVAVNVPPSEKPAGALSHGSQRRAPLERDRANSTLFLEDLLHRTAHLSTVPLSLGPANLGPYLHATRRQPAGYVCTSERAGGVFLSQAETEREGGSLLTAYVNRPGGDRRVLMLIFLDPDERCIGR